jgi:PBP1b-binding outer membrane lipoprotein LpoB
MTTQNNSVFVIGAIILLAILLVGCASGPTRVEKDYGNSVHAMQRAQTLDPMTIIAPDMTPVESTDGQRMENAINASRETVAAPAATSRPMEIVIGN